MIVLVALLCPLMTCTPNTAMVVISHRIEGTCGSALMQLMQEAAASPVQGGNWTFTCRVMEHGKFQ